MRGRTGAGRAARPPPRTRSSSERAGSGLGDMPDSPGPIALGVARLLVLDESVQGLPFVRPLTLAVMRLDEAPVSVGLVVRCGQSRRPVLRACRIAGAFALSVLVEGIKRCPVRVDPLPIALLGRLGQGRPGKHGADRQQK